MLAELLPLMTDSVRQWHSPLRDIFGRASIVPPLEITDDGELSVIAGTKVTEHRARILHTAGTLIGPASRERERDATATVWLIDHPHAIAIGDTFELPEHGALKVIRLERRQLAGATLSKVFFS